MIENKEKSNVNAPEKPSDTKENKIISEIADLPEHIGEYGEVNDLPDEIGEENDKKGGAYKDLPKMEGKQKHHMPADSTTDLSRDDGPCILIDEGDHKKTASYGYSKDAQEYRAKQKESIEQGKFDIALKMDIDDLKEKFGDKYDDAIFDLKEYYKKMKDEGKIQ